MDMIQMGRDAKQASFALATASTAQKNQALHIIADELEANLPAILAANAIDINLWKRSRID